MALCSDLANQYHSIQIIPDELDIFKASGKSEGELTFNGINTWDDWHLIPSSRPLINPPGFRSEFIDVPGFNGSIDVSTILTGYPTYTDRSGSFDFYVLRDYDDYISWSYTYSKIMEYLHGRKFKIILDDDKGYYYVGRMTVNAWKSEKDWSKITLDYRVEPFKYSLVSSLEPWLWDPFDFKHGVVPDYGAYGGADAEEGITLEAYYVKKWRILAGAMPICPEILYKSYKTTSNQRRYFYAKKYVNNELVVDKYVILNNDGEWHSIKVPEITFVNEENDLGLHTMYSDVHVKILFRYGKL